MQNIISHIARFNFWNENSLELGYPRTYYTNKIIDYVGNKLIKVLVGQRRVGKSYILRQIAQRIIHAGVPSQNILYINKEYTEFDSIVSASKLQHLIREYEEQLKPVGKIYLFIDEVQNIQDWEKTINAWSQDFTKEYEIFITGSNSNLLSGELATLLSGRYVQFSIFPFSFSEYISLLSIDCNKQNYISYLQTSGLPELFHLPTEETKRHYVSAVKDTVLLRDVIQRHTIKDVKLLEDIFVFLIINASHLISITNIVNYFKSKKRITNYETVANYIKYIEDSFLIYKTERYSIKGKDTIAGIYKYYINDLSFVNYLYSGFGYGIGYKLENLIFIELKRAGYEVYIGVVKNKEVDFVAIKSNRKIYIQCAYILIDNETIEREYSALEAIADNFEKYVVTLDDVQFESKEGIKHIQAWNLHTILL
jgi:predicted AAA+ superfamily ATPase